MKLLHLLFVMIAIQLAYLVFYVPANIDDGLSGIFYEGNYSNATATYAGANYSTLPGFNETSISGYTSRSVWTSILNPFNGTTTPIMILLIALAGSFWVLGIVYRSEMVMLSSLAVILLTVGTVPCWSLWIMISSDVGAFACTVESTCAVSDLFAFAIAGILYIMWIFSCLELLSARSMA